MNLKTTPILELVRPSLVAVEERMLAMSRHDHGKLSTAIEHLVSSGGKRIRPTIVLLTGTMLGAENERLISLAAAAEMLHTATLVHDDLIDGSRVRRGIPTLNAQWSPGATVLAGDFIFARAAELAAETESTRLMTRFAQTLMTIVNGELRQLFGSQTITTRPQYFERISAKTASLFELCAEGAGVLAGAGEASTKHLKDYGRCVGLAFQISDDVLDVVGQEEQVGKPIANDLRQGLVTLPTLCYMERHPDDPDVQALLRDGRLEEGQLERLVRSIRESGAIDSAFHEARDYARQATSHLDSFPACPERDALAELASYAINRSS